jgi:fructosamine-3-kinase
MSHDAGEVSWHTLRRIVRDWAGDQAELDEVSGLDGGSISTTLKLTTRNGDRAVLKLSSHRVDRSYLREAHQLRLLRSLGLPAPRVYDCHIGSLESPDSYLLLELLPGVDLHEAKNRCSAEAYDALQRQLGEIVAALHAHTSEHYGRVESPDTPNPGNGDGKNWPAFYRGLYDAIWHECEKTGHLPVKTRRVIARVHQNLDRLLHHSDRPRLTHGDLWASNVLAAPSDAAGGAWVVTGLLDPNCKFAHAESELAYLDLFHTVTPAFTKVYHQAFKVDDDYHRQRKPVYQLYELVNHVNLFGDRYIKPLQQTLDRVTPLL